MFTNSVREPHLRRTFLQTLVFGVGSFALEGVLRGQSPGTEKEPDIDHRTALHQQVDLRASPARVQAVLLDAGEFSAFTKLKAEIDPREGGAFSLFGGLIIGRNIEIVHAARIVQAWRPTHWDPGVYSVVRFGLKASGPITTVVLDHTGFPEGDYDHLFSGWQAHYWDSLKAYFG